MDKIELTAKEVDFLDKYVQGKYNALIAPIEQQDIEIELIDKASAYERANELIDERIDFSPDCDLLKWYYHKYKTQQLQN